MLPILLIVFLLLIALFISSPAENKTLISACGDGICDPDDKLNCLDDCTAPDSGKPGDNNISNSTKPDGSPQFCGDGSCDEKERLEGICPEDCTASPPIINPISTGYEDSPFGISIEYDGLESYREIDSRFISPPGATKDYLIDLGVKWVGETYIFFERADTTDGSFTIPQRTRDTDLDDMAVGLYESRIKTMNIFATDMPSWDQETCHASNPCSLPCDENAYKLFVKKIVERYDGDEDFGCTVAAPDCYKTGDGQYPSAQTREAILNNPWKYWSTGNEPDMGCPEKGGCFFKPCELGRGMDEYFHIMEMTYSAIKEVCPDCKVSNGALAGILSSLAIKGDEQPPDEMALATWLQRLDSTESEYFDVMNFHGYDSIVNLEARLQIFSERYMQTKGMIITEMGALSNDNPFDVPIPNYYYSEQTQAQEIVKRYLFPIKHGVDVIAFFTLVDGGVGNCSLLPAEKACDEGSKWGLLTVNGTKKLAYFSYKLMVEKLEGSNWTNLQEIYNSNNMHVFKLLKNGQPIWVAWWDYWNEPGAATKSVTLQLGASGNLRITEAVPRYDSGQQVTNYATAFNTGGAVAGNGQVTLQLGKSPVYIESISQALPAYVPHTWSAAPIMNPQPSGCNNNGKCEPGETSTNCPQDCANPSGGDKPHLDGGKPPLDDSSYCGDGTCDGAAGEKENCPQDCPQ